MAKKSEIDGLNDWLPGTERAQQGNWSNGDFGVFAIPGLPRIRTPTEVSPSIGWGIMDQFFFLGSAHRNVLFDQCHAREHGSRSLDEVELGRVCFPIFTCLSKAFFILLMPSIRSNQNRDSWSWRGFENNAQWAGFGEFSKRLTEPSFEWNWLHRLVQDYPLKWWITKQDVGVVYSGGEAELNMAREGGQEASAKLR